MMTTQDVPQLPQLHLYTSIHSSSAARIHIAAYLKGILLETTDVSLSSDEGWPPESITSINPAAKLPVLEIKDPESGKTTVLTQSMAILQLFEENFTLSGMKLLPSQNEWQKRAKVNELVSLVCSDIQPPTNQTPVGLINQLSTTYASSLLPPGTALPAFSPSNPSPGKQFAQRILSAGLAAYNELIKDCAGKYSVGDDVTLADVCLVPAVQMAEAYGVVLKADIENPTKPTERFRRVVTVYENCMKMWEFREGSRRDGQKKVHPYRLHVDVDEDEKDKEG
jgi:maleylacetoacetate isomerase